MLFRANWRRRRCADAVRRLFFHKTMRFDYYHAGDSRSEEYFFDALKEGGEWAGSKVSLVDTTGYGNQFFRIVHNGVWLEVLIPAASARFSTSGRVRPKPTAWPLPASRIVCSPIPNVRAGSRFSPATAKGVSRAFQPDKYRPRFLFYRAVHAPLRDVRGDVFRQFGAACGHRPAA